MRGKAHTPKNSTTKEGITPAYAGKRDYFTRLELHV